MKPKQRISRKIWVVLIVVLIFQILFDPLSVLIDLGESAQARVWLPYARRKWEARDISHYRFDIRGSMPLVCIFSGSIEVKDETVIHTGRSSDAEADIIDVGFSTSKDWPLCNYHNYTMPRLFEEVERWQRRLPFYGSNISFDPTYGFISGFGFGSSGGNGLLSPRISDCCGGFSIRNFQVLDE